MKNPVVFLFCLLLGACSETPRHYILFCGSMGTDGIVVTGTLVPKEKSAGTFDLFTDNGGVIHSSYSRCIVMEKKQ